MGDNQNRQEKPTKHDEEMLDRALEQSFPASDPPEQTIPAIQDKDKKPASQQSRAQGNAPQGHLQQGNDQQ
jgi:hypothetical protein